MKSLGIALLRVPLRWKLVGANALLLAGAFVATVLTRHSPADVAIVWLWIILAVSFALNLGLLALALRPLRLLERTASRVAAGDLAARVAPSAMHDRDVARIGATMNRLLDDLIGDRERMRGLAAQVIRTEEDQRSHTARELHDSVAQTLAAAKLQLHVLSEASGADAPLMAAQQERVAVIASLLSGAIDEVRALSHSVYPHVLDDLGLVPALERLARQEAVTGIDVHVDANAASPQISREARTALYLVAQEGVRNAVAHTGASAVVLHVRADDRQATLEVADDGPALDAAAADAGSPLGLFALRERLTLVNGSLAVRHTARGGTRIFATVPLRSDNEE